jgi:hypothetical protein
MLQNSAVPCALLPRDSCRIWVQTGDSVCRSNQERGCCLEAGDLARLEIPPPNEDPTFLVAKVGGRPRFR